MAVLKNARLLIVDDEITILRFMQQVLENDGHQCDVTQTIDEAKSKIATISYDLVITDLKMPDGSGLEFLQFVSENYPEVGRIMMTGYNTMEVARDVLKIGVYGYLIKPMERDIVLITIQNALRHMLLEKNMFASLNETKNHLVEQHNTFKLIIDNIPIGVVMVDKSLRVIEQNNAMLSLFPHLQEKRSFHCSEIVPTSTDEEQEFTCPMQVAFDTKSLHSSQRMIRTKTGNVEFKITALPIVDTSGQFNRGIMLFHDISEIVSSQKDIAETNRLLSVGQLAAGIAHEINTPTQFIGDNINFIQDSFDDLGQLLSLNVRLAEAHKNKKPVSPELCEDLAVETLEADVEYLLEELPVALNQTQDGIQRIASIVRAMKEFSHPGEREKLASNINELITTTLTVCNNEWKYVAKIKLMLDDTLPLVQCYASEISQVILILIVNAAHAIAGKMEENQNGIGEIQITTLQKDDESIQIFISDTGGGIPLEIQDKIFQPFFTTKKRGKGTGQGLSLAQKIIDETHDGKIAFTSTPGQGTEFSITLPINEK